MKLMGSISLEVLMRKVIAVEQIVKPYQQKKLNKLKMSWLCYTVITVAVKGNGNKTINLYSIEQFNHPIKA